MKTPDILIDTLRYAKRFNGKFFVIKFSGDITLNDDVFNASTEDIVLLDNAGIKPIVVHGGGLEISNMMEKFGKKSKFIEGLRVTDKETVDIVKMILVGKINTEIVARINKHGGNAVGLSGKSGKLFLAKKKNSA